ncbi:MAG: cbb3-type cytochrome c oxidase subunit I [Opitutales bacterium]
MDASVSHDSPQAVSPDSSQAKVRLSEIDQSMRGPGLFFLIFAIFWLLFGTLFAVLASIKMHDPDFLALSTLVGPETPGLLKGIYYNLDAAFTHGRSRSAHLNAMIYGWSNNAIFAVCLWIMARLCRTPVRHGGLLYAAGVVWNIAVAVGIAGILSGGLTSVEWLEMPFEIAPVLALSYVLIGLWGVLCFRYRDTGHVYVSQWYFLAALFWFPWLYTIAQMIILWFPARGTIQAVTNWWFAHNVLGLWLTPMALGAIYYLLPKVIGRPIYSYYLSILGFWTLALFYNWAGLHHLIGGPVPVWMTSVGTVASVMMVIPVVVTAINHHMTAAGNARAVWASPTLRFIVFGGLNYTAVSLAGSAMALREVNEISHFTQLTVGHAHQGVYAFFTAVMFGGIYFMLPRLLNREWPSAGLIRLHFWSVFWGMVLMLGALHWGGWEQGLLLNQPQNADVPYVSGELGQMTIVGQIKPYLVARSLSGILLTVGHVVFAVNFFWMLKGGRLSQREGGATLLSPEYLERRAPVNA